MTKLIKALNPDELQSKLEHLQTSDAEDRPWWLHGEAFRTEGYWYQFLTDENPNPRVTLVLDPTNILDIAKRIKKEM